MVLHFIKERNYFSKILAGMRGITLTNYLSEQEIVEIFFDYLDNSIYKYRREKNDYRNAIKSIKNIKCYMFLCMG